ncbi:DUF2187 domain-containing protein [Apilactobacillus apisilvae]|uniref:DUF2187 domain-containing protein n=1 Tax=Apilactobacillus apisilvae TaxID=2923364 RepID=A0ABY4PIH3_9LACO|nr:DUF2187 domain-containing protein [Apilactobacillus apisilvae]UQS85246.1 DUF2187 domain-containing protein [Apilactobacillus apisilvae]
MAELKIGDYIAAPRFGYLKHDFSGTIDKIYENSVMVLINEHHQDDDIVVNEYNQRAIVSKKQAKLIKKQTT